MGLPNINEFITNVRREYHEMGVQTVKRIESGYLLLQLLAAEGIFFDVSQFDLKYGRTFTVTVQQLAIVRRVLGRLRKGATYPVEKSRNKIWVDMHPVDAAYDGFRFRYQTKLPTGAKCKIVKQRRSETRRYLVCEA